MGSLNTFDWFLVVVLAVSTIAAFQRGIVRVLFSIFGLIAGILIASWNYEALAERLNRWISWGVTAQIVAFLLILVGVVMAFAVAARILRKTLGVVGLGFVDRLLGGAFGLLRGFLFGVVAMMAIAAFDPESSWVKNSQLAPYFLGGAHAVSFVVPDQFQRQVTEGATLILHEAPELLKPHRLGWKQTD